MVTAVEAIPAAVEVVETEEPVAELPAAAVVEETVTENIVDQATEDLEALETDLLNDAPVSEIILDTEDIISDIIEADQLDENIAEDKDVIDELGEI